MRRINEAGLSLLKAFEGCRLRAYKDQGGVITIGYGHTPAEEGQNITQDQVEELLARDLDKFETGICVQVTTPLSDNQFSALVCFSFNIGLGNFHDSTLKRKLNEGKYQEAANWFLPWHKIHGVEVEALLHRREAEMQLFLKPNEKDKGS